MPNQIHAAIEKKALIIPSPIGEIGLCVDERDDMLTNVFLRPGILRMIPLPSGEDDPVLLEAKKQFAEYFAGKRSDFSLPCHGVVGRGLLGQVLLAVMHIPYGETVTAQEIADTLPPVVEDVETPDPSITLSDAVRGALFYNPLPIVIPCHRVKDEGGEPFFAGSPRQQQALLELEKRFRANFAGDQP